MRGLGSGGLGVECNEPEEKAIKISLSDVQIDLQSPNSAPSHIY